MVRHEIPGMSQGARENSLRRIRSELALEVVVCYYSTAVWKADHRGSRGLLFTCAHRQGGGQGSEIAGSRTLPKRVALGKEKVKFLAGVADLGRRAPRAMMTKSDKKRQKVTKSAIRPVIGRDFTAAQWILVKKR